MIGRLGESEPDAGADGGDEGEGGDVDGGEEGANARADELGAHAEGDDVLVRRDGEEEEPDRGRVLGQAQRHALENGVQGQRQHHEESAQGCLIFDAEREIYCRHVSHIMGDIADSWLNCWLYNSSLSSSVFLIFQMRTSNDSFSESVVWLIELSESDSEATPPVGSNGNIGFSSALTIECKRR